MVTDTHSEWSRIDESCRAIVRVVPIKLSRDVWVRRTYRSGEETAVTVASSVVESDEVFMVRREGPADVAGLVSRRISQGETLGGGAR